MSEPARTEWHEAAAPGGRNVEMIDGVGPLLYIRVYGTYKRGVYFWTWIIARGLLSNGSVAGK